MCGAAAGNNIRDAGATAVAEALKTNSTLSSLDLRGECVVCGLAMIVGAVVRRAGGSGWRGEGVAATVGWMAIGGGGGRQGVGVRARLVWLVGGMWWARWVGVECAVGLCVGCGGVWRALLAWLSEHGRWRHAMAGWGGLSVWCLC